MRHRRPDRARNFLGKMRFRPCLEKLEDRVVFAALPGLAASVNWLTPAVGGPNGSGSASAFDATDSAYQVAMQLLSANASSLGLTASDLADVEVTNQYTSKPAGPSQFQPQPQTRATRAWQGVESPAAPPSNEVTHLYLRQRFNGLEIVNAPMNINLAATGEVVSAFSDFVRLPAGAPPAIQPALSAAEALQLAGPELSLTVTTAPRVVSGPSGIAWETTLNAPELSLDPIPAKLDYFADESGRLQLVWSVVLATPDHRHWYDAQLDAATGKVVQVNDWVHSAAYDVVPAKFSSPEAHPRELLVDPHDPEASPFGWHDTNGIVGAEYTDTRGNNVFAQDDVDGDNAGGTRPDGGVELVFDFPFDDTQPAASYLSASTTNLFYVINSMHDLLWHYGFDEAAGNFQQLNYTGAGQGGDPVNAYSQDANAANNANFASPPDGRQPRMQVGVWTATSESITSNTDGLGDPTEVGTAEFGPQAFDLTGQLAYAEPPLAESPLTNDVSGKIVLIDRGAVSFVLKARAAQTAGAIGVVIADNEPGGPINLTGDGPDINIPVLMVSQEYGEELKAALAAGPVSLSMYRDSQERDAAFDNETVMHEYMHGVTNRLTGGPANANALRQIQGAAMGEGWSDWLALLLTQRPSDTAETPRPASVYAGSSPAGIRRVEYSTDMSIDPLTFEFFIPTPSGSMTEEHNAGEIWASTLWDLTWLLQDKYGYDADYSTGYTGLGNGATGNKLALQLVLDALKLQPANPSFVEARDAILLADILLTGGEDFDLIWSAFARRGLGWSAATDNGNSSIVEEAFDVPGALPLVTTAREATSPGGSFTVEFNRLIRSDFTLADIQSFVGPDAQDYRDQIIGFDFDITRSRLTLDTSATLPLGVFTLVLSPGIADVQGGLLDQDQDGVGGEPLEDEASVQVLISAPNATFVVNTNADQNDIPYDPSEMSLREAVAWANLLPGADRIEFAPVTSGIPFWLESGQIDVTDSLSIIGEGPADTVLDAQLASRIFDASASAGDLQLVKLTLTHGQTPEDADRFEPGGAVRFLSPGTLTLDECVIFENQTLGDDEAGGGVYTRTGNVVVRDSTLSGNVTLGEFAGGAAIASGGITTVTDSTFRDNYTLGDFASGGAIRAGSGLEVTRSTFSGNSTTGRNASGGAIIVSSGASRVVESTFNDNWTEGWFAMGGALTSFGGKVDLIQSTFSGNSTLSSLGVGGAVRSAFGDVNVLQSTFVLNEAAASRGGAISTTGGALTVRNSIIAANADRDGSSNLAPGGALSVAYSLIGANDGTTLVATATPDHDGNLIGTLADPFIPGLLELADNGGPTLTHALKPDSPALNRGDNGAIPAGATNDQRGSSFARVVNYAVDMGAVESQTIGSSPTVEFNSTTKSLVVRGTTLGEWIDVNPRSPDDIVVVVGGTTFGPYRDSSVDTVTVYGQQGDDRIRVGAVVATAFVYGDAGDDTLATTNQGRAILRGGAGNDRLSGNLRESNVLDGGAGDDKLFGGLFARDLLIGGTGDDQLVGSVLGENILLGGTTIHDGNDQALLSILAEWSQRQPTETRMLNLSQGGGLNGSFVLAIRSTVLDDNTKDSIQGGVLKDWLFRFGKDNLLRGLLLPDIISS